MSTPKPPNPDEQPPMPAPTWIPRPIEEPEPDELPDEKRNPNPDEVSDPPNIYPAMAAAVKPRPEGTKRKFPSFGGRRRLWRSNQAKAHYSWCCHSGPSNLANRALQKVKRRQ